MKKKYSIILLLITVIFLSNAIYAQDNTKTTDSITTAQIDYKNIENTDNNVEKNIYSKVISQDDEDNNLDDESERMGCATTIIQGYNNDSALSFRRDATDRLTIHVKHNDTFIKQYKYNDYFFHVMINKDGWMIGNGGSDSESITRIVEKNALPMIRGNKFITSNLNNIYEIKSNSSVSHFVIKSPNGTYKLMIKSNKKVFKSSGVLKPGECLTVPNSAKYFKKSSVHNISSEEKMITESRLLAAKDYYGINRREIITYYYKNNYYNSTIKISAANDNGKYVQMKTASRVDNIQTNTIFFNASSIPEIDNYISIDNITYILRNRTITPEEKLATSITLVNTTGTIGEKTTYYAYVKDSEGKNVTGGNFVFKLNDITLKNSLGNVMKTNVVNGMAKMTIDATSRFNHAKITATYSGSSQYNSSRSTVNAYTNFTQRKAQLTVNITDNEPEQYDTIRFNVKINDLTSNNTKKALYNPKAFVIFKINGITLKDINGNTIKVNVNKNASATYNYTIAKGMAGYKDGKVRYYNVTARYSSPDYTVEEIINDSFTVKRSNITIKADEITLDNESKKLSLKANILDYKNNTVIGFTRICIKINGKTFEINDSNVVIIENGVINLVIDISPIHREFNEISLVVGQRNSYNSCRKNLKLTSIYNVP